MHPTARRLAQVVAVSEIQPNRLTGAPAKIIPRIAHKPQPKAPTTFALLESQRERLRSEGQWPENIRLEAGVPRQRMRQTRRKDRKAFKEIMRER